MSPLKVLLRGYSVTENAEGTVIRSVSQVQSGEQITVSLSDGSLIASVKEVKENGT